MRIVFFGTPQFAANVLDYLCNNGVEVSAVVSKPDKPKGRSKKLVATPVKVVAEKRHLPLYQPEKVSSDEYVSILRQYNADLFVVVAYGEIIKQSLLDVPRLACINIHASLLPKYRGAAPIQRAIIDGEQETGITIMHMVKKMDAGDVIKTRKVSIGLNDTYGDIEKRLCEVGSELILEVIGDFDQGCDKRISQDENLVTFAPKIELEDCEINWKRSSEEIHNLVRGVNPHPGAWCFVVVKGEKKRLKIFRTEIVNDDALSAGDFRIERKTGVTIGCGEGALKVESLQLEGKRVMTGKEFALGVSPESLALCD